ncbi:MAG: TraG/TraD/VirD4 family protein, partial [Rhodocyclaceae bacterium]|nr:TraG/TraD/VirD4 family protein [Rhodocyclaceae bacterium]
MCIRDSYALARWFGRDDDLLTLNFLLAGKTPEQVRKSRRRRTNKTNPFSTADADTIIQMGANLLPKVDGDAKNWQEKALNCWRGLVPALCWLRDHEGWEISVRHFVDYLALPKLEWLYCKGYDVAHKNGGVWHEGFEGLRAYLEVGLPGFKVELALKKYHGKDGFTYPLPENAAPAMGPGGRPQQGGDQSGQVYEQHGYRATQLNPALNLLDKTYGHIFADKFSEVDMVDVTLNNRILAMLIPSLEKSAQEAESLGKLNVAVLKVMMGKNLGAEIEGSRREILEAKATEANYPYIVALDELGYYFADGIAVMFAQARSLGFAMFAAAQDIEKLTEGSRSAEAGAMLANQVTKVFMRIDDANKTNEMIQKYLDKVTVALRKSYEWDEITGFKRVPEVAIEEIPPVTLKNLQSMKPGRGVINAMGLTLKIKSLYVGDFLQKYKREWFHINRFLQVRSLTPREVEENSLPINVLGDPYIKGYKLLEMLRGSRPLPDFDEVASGKPYEEDYRLAQAMLQEVAAVSERLPEGARGAQRAIYLFEAARLFLMKHGRLPPDAVYADLLKGASGRSGGGPQPRDNDLMTQESTSGQSIERGSGSGDLAEPLGAEDDPFDFLNESCPLKRKPAQDVMSDGAQAPSKLLQTDAQALEPVARVLREGSSMDAGADEAPHSAAQDARGSDALDALFEPRKKALPALDDDDDDEASVSATEALRQAQASLVLPQALQRSLAQVFDGAVIFEMPAQKAQAQRNVSAQLDPASAASVQDQEYGDDLGEQRRQAQQAKAAATDAHDWVCLL